MSAVSAHVRRRSPRDGKQLGVAWRATPLPSWRMVQGVQRTWQTSPQSMAVSAAWERRPLPSKSKAAKASLIHSSHCGDSCAPRTPAYV